jgi:hypothetical protein
VHLRRPLDSIPLPKLQKLTARLVRSQGFVILVGTPTQYRTESPPEWGQVFLFDRILEDGEERAKRTGKSPA